MGSDNVSRNDGGYKLDQAEIGDQAYLESCPPEL